MCLSSRGTARWSAAGTPPPARLWRRGAEEVISVLTMAAEDRRSAGDAHGGHGTAAREAGFACATVHEQLLLLAADIAPCVAVGVHRAAAILDSGLERLPQRLVQPARRLAADATCEPVGSKARFVKR